jgi:uroporphyrinogen decarboxylase
VNDLILRALRGEPAPRRPLWIMRQAGRYLPEYRAFRHRHSFEELCANPELAAEVTLMPLERFPLDGAIVFADLMSPVAALGIDCRFDPGPVIDPPLREAAQIRDLPDPDPRRIAPEVMETLARVRERLDGRATLLGFAGGPWSLAAYLVEGRGVRNFPTLRRMAAADPALLDELLARLADLAGKYVAMQARAGAQAVQIFETWSGLLSAADWNRLVKPHLKRVLESAGDAGLPRILFLQDAPHLIDAVLDLPAEGLSFDWRVDLAAVRSRLSPERTLQGNLDPAVLLAGPEATRKATRALLGRVPARGHIVNLGHGILPETPLESVTALVETVHAEGGTA